MKRILSIASLLLVACSKHSGDTTNEPIPANRLTVLAPTANASYHRGDSIWVKAEAVSEALIHGYKVGIREAGSSSDLFYTEVHDHNDTLHISQYWVNDRTAPANLEARIILTLNHNGDSVIQTIPIHSL
ncbi:hypothetical protein [Flaviaesturariibacter terrae]